MLTMETKRYHNEIVIISLVFCDQLQDEIDVINHKAIIVDFNGQVGTNTKRYLPIGPYGKVQRIVMV